MKKIFIKGIALLTALTSIAGSMVLIKPTEKVNAASGKILAFPGAVGGGKYATGGRDGEVYHVTNLNDSGTGSLRDAVSKPNRIVVFDVSGTITLKSNIVCSDNITIAGQTAPGGSGVTLKDYKFGMGGDNIIVRYLSSRPGPDKATSSGNDAWGGAKGSNSIVDHCSLGWTTDEQWGIYSNNDHYTVQYSVIGPANSWGGHVKGIHGFGLMMGRSNLTFDHNLICHNVSRNFRGKVVGTESADFTDNVIYDWGYQTAYGTIGHVNYVNNTLKAGNSTTGGYHYVQVSSSDNFKLYLKGNRILNKDNSVRNNENSNWSAISYVHSDKNQSNTESTTPFTILTDGENLSTALTCESSADSYDHVITFAGNGITSDKRTAIDKECAADVKNGTGTCSGTEAYDSSQSGLDKYKIKCGVTYSYPSAVTKKEIKDSDNDGMPDDWEIARGLNPNDPSDYKGDYCGKGYMNIEYYINDLTVNSFPAGTVTLSPTSGKQTTTEATKSTESPTKTTEATTQSVKTISAFTKIEAENFSEQSGVTAEDLKDGSGKDVGYIENGDWIAFKNVDFADGAKAVSMKLGGKDLTVELYLDSINSKPVQTINVKNTGSFTNYQDLAFNFKNMISGTHDLYIKFVGGSGFLTNIDNFVFSKTPVAAVLDTNKCYRLKNVNSGLYMTVDENKNGANVSQEGGNTSVYNTFKFVQGENSRYYIQSLVGTKEFFLDITGKKTDDGTNVDVYYNKNQINQQFKLLKNTDGSYILSTGVTNDLSAVEVKDASKTDGANVQQWALNGVNCQDWILEETPEPVETTAAVPTTASPTETNKPQYDINGDGILNIADAVMLQKYLLRKSDLTNVLSADVNGDKKINVVDLSMLVNLLK